MANLIRKRRRPDDILKKVLEKAASDFLGRYTHHRRKRNSKLPVTASLQAAFNDVAEKYLGVRPLQNHRQTPRWKSSPNSRAKNRLPEKSVVFDEDLQRLKDFVDGKRNV